MKRLAMTWAVFVGGCATQPVPQSAPRPATSIAASFGRTWDAVIDQMAGRNIPIRSMERVSGFIASGQLPISRDRVKEFGAYADCGSLIGITLYPDFAEYNVVVRGDSTTSTVHTTVRWVNRSSDDSNAKLKDCVSRGTWETAFEAEIKRRAETAK